MGLAVAAILALITAPVAMAANYNVSTNPYRTSRTLASAEAWDTHELVAQSGQTVKYSMNVTTSGACLSLLFVKGHNANAQSQYYVAYSQTSCVTSYSNSFPVASSDGTQFTVLLPRSAAGDIAYAVSIEITTPAVPSWAVGLLVLIVIGVVVGVVVALIRRRRRPAAMPPMAPPPYIGAPGSTIYPPAQPPQEPWQPPSRPP